MITTANEMADEVERRVDRESAFASPGYEDFDMTSVLSEAEWLYVKTFIAELNNRKGHGFEETEIRNQGLSALISNGSATVSSDQTGIYNFTGVLGKFYDLPDDFMYTIHEIVVIDKNHCTTSNPIVAEVRNVSHKEVMRFKKNKYKKPFYNSYESQVWRGQYKREVDGYADISTRTSKRHQIITDGTFTVSSYNLSYMQNPKGLIVDRITPANQRNSILDDSTKEVIIQLAVDLLMERVKEGKIVNTNSITELE